MRGLAMVFLLAALPSLALAAGPLPVATKTAATTATLEFPKNLSNEQTLRFVAGLSGDQARLLVLQRLDELRTREAAAEQGPSGLAVVMVRMRMDLQGRVSKIRERLGVLAGGIPRTPGAVAGILGRLQSGFWLVALATLAVVGFGLVLRALAQRGTASFRGHLEAIQGGRVIERAGRLALRALLDLLGITAYGLGGVVLLALFFDRGGLDQAFAFSYLTAGLIILAVQATSRFLLAPRAPALRLIALDDGLAVALHNALVRLAAVASIVWLTTAFLILQGGPPFGVHLSLVLLSGLIVLGLVVHTVWRLRRPLAELLSARPGVSTSDLKTGLAGNWHLFMTAYIAVVAALWSISMLTSGHSVLWPAVGSVALVALYPLLDIWLSRAIGQLVGSFLVDQYTPVVTAAGDEGDDAQPLQVDHEAIARNAERYSRILRRGTRLALIFLIGLAVLELWGLDVLRLLGAPGAGAVWKAVFDIGVVVLLAYLVWQLIEAALTRSAGADAAPEAPPEARAQTLLPLIRKFILIVIAVMVAMIALASIGVDIGPLLAGAGVVGLAIGFGAQALVRDVVAGVFFLVDDAFRVGEYIEVDEKIRGEVEAISVRSLRLRHHRGAVITLPFGELKQITNHNRDWTIYKMPIRVAADTDPKAVKKIVKQIGQEMMADPELGPKLIQPLKSQGVFAIDDDSALIMRVKFMCKPRQQFVLRREAYHRIQNAFAAHGIEIARRKVEVSVPDELDSEGRSRALRGASEAAETAAGPSGTASAAEAV